MLSWLLLTKGFNREAHVLQWNPLPSSRLVERAATRSRKVNTHPRPTRTPSSNPQRRQSRIVAGWTPVSFASFFVVNLVSFKAAPDASRTCSSSSEVRCGRNPDLALEINMDLSTGRTECLPTLPFKICWRVLTQVSENLCKHPRFNQPCQPRILEKGHFSHSGWLKCVCGHPQCHDG